MASSPTTIVGNVVRDPELKFMADGTAKLEFSVAANHNWRDAAGEWQTKASYFDCVAWRKSAEDFARVLEKGVGVIVAGRLEQRSWDDKDTGQKRSKVEVLVDDCGILTRSVESFERRRGGAEDAPQSKAAPSKKAARPTPEDEPF
jgi:single-strand DNA-binding protein